MRSARMQRSVRLTSAAAMIAFGGTSVSPSQSPRASTATTLAGYVSNGIVGPIAGALVTVTAGPSTGATSLTDSEGYFRMAYSYGPDGRLQVTKEGFAPTMAHVAAPPSGGIAIVLHAATPPLMLDGAYAATFAADAACTQVPEAVRTRSYTAVVRQAPQFPQSTSFDVTLSGGSFAPAQQPIGGALNSFFGFVEANSIDFRIWNRYEASEIDEGIGEEVAPHALLEIQGEARLTVNDASTIEAPLSGSFSFTDATGSRTCKSSHHSVVLRKGIAGGME